MYHGVLFSAINTVNQIGIRFIHSVDELYNLLRRILKIIINSNNEFTGSSRYPTECCIVLPEILGKLNGYHLFIEFLLQLNEYLPAGISTVVIHENNFVRLFQADEGISY